jgi:predicted acetyltransferase
LEEIAEIRANLESSEVSQKEMLDEYAAKLQAEIQASKDFLVKKQNTETKEIAKQIFKMDKDFKSAAEIGKTNEESIANLRGKIELPVNHQTRTKKIWETMCRLPDFRSRRTLPGGSERARLFSFGQKTSLK